MNKTITIGKRKIGFGHPAYIIFEVASTHANDWEIAKAYVDQAADAGADAIKFQLFRAETLTNPLTKNLQTVYEYFKIAEMPREWFPRLKKLCDKRSIDLLCTPFGTDVVMFLNNVGMPAMKIASGDLTNHQLLAHVALFHKPIILSTGTATMEEIKKAVDIVRDAGNDFLALLQCVSVYPTSFDDANVSAMLSLQKEFETVIGYSDNGSKGFLVPLLAVALGASIIEKHVTSQKERGAIDDIFSLSVEEFGKMVKRIRAIEKRTDQDAMLKELEEEYGEDFKKAYGDGIKRPMPYGTLITYFGKPFVQTEGDERQWVRRGVYFARAMKKDDVVRDQDIILLRPDVGISSMRYKDMIGKKVLEDVPLMFPKIPLKLGKEGIRRLQKNDVEEMYAGVEYTQLREMLLGSSIWDH